MFAGFLWVFPGRREPSHTSSSSARRDIGPSRCHDDQIRGEFIADSCGFLLPMINLPLVEDQRTTVLGGKKDTDGLAVSDPLESSTCFCFVSLSVSVCPSVRPSLSLSLYCGWLLTLSVLCDEGVFCCFWGCGFS